MCLYVQLCASQSEHFGKELWKYQRLKKYDIITIGEQEKRVLFLHLKVVLELHTMYVCMYVCMEGLFHVFHETQLKIGYGGRNLMVMNLDGS
jgi:hypothetical protein